MTINNQKEAIGNFYKEKIQEIKHNFKKRQSERNQSIKGQEKRFRNLVQMIVKSKNDVSLSSISNSEYIPSINSISGILCFIVYYF